MVKQKAILQLRRLLNGEDTQGQISSIDSQIANFYEPKNFSGPESIEIKYERHYEDACFFISKELKINIDSMTTFRFYNALSYIKKSQEEIKKAYGKQSNKI